MAQHNVIGKEGEDLAVNYLLKKSYKILYRNWRYKGKELDIVSENNGLLIVVEVKTRTDGYFQNISEIITPRKRKYIIETSNEFINQKNIDTEVRFDIIFIIKKKRKISIEHIENAFSAMI